MKTIINKPSHYCTHKSGVECLDIAQSLPYLLGNAFKYCFRARYKDNFIDDLDKALFMLKRYLDNHPAFYFRDYTTPVLFERLIKAERKTDFKRLFALFYKAYDDKTPRSISAIIRKIIDIKKTYSGFKVQVLTLDGIKHGKTRSKV